MGSSHLGYGIDNYHFVGHDIAVFTQIDIILLNDPKGKKMLIHHKT